jgi:glycerol-3-phosphate dehydrogenase
VKREIAALCAERHDLIVVGGGIYGAAAAREAALAGLRVALVERGDFGSGTSWNSFKIIHGGIRYLQQLDLRRLRKSLRARRRFLRLAPHLIEPLHFALPAQGSGRKGRLALRIGGLAYDLASADRNLGVASARRIPRTRLYTREELARLAPHLECPGTTGALGWWDAQMYSSERVLVEFLLAAAELGAQIANRVEVVSFLTGRARVDGVAAFDRASGREIELRADHVLCCTGPDSFPLHARDRALERPPPELSRAANLVLRQRLFDCAVALPVRGAAAGQGEQTLFAAPWRGRTLVGTLHLPLEPGGRCALRESELEQWLAAVNRLLPRAPLVRSDVALVHVGIQPVARWDARSGLPVHAPEAIWIDHAERDGIAGLSTLVGVKYTEAPEEARAAVERIAAVLGRGAFPAREPLLPGARGDVSAAALCAQRERSGAGVSEAQARHLAASYGAIAPSVLELAPDSANLQPLAPESPVCGAELVRAFREEMAQSLADAVLRRCELGARGDLDDATQGACAEVAARELGWNRERRDAELAALRAELAHRMPH